MTTLEKAIALLQTMPENKLERKNANSIVGIAHQYANPALIPLEKEAFANAMSEKI